VFTHDIHPLLNLKQNILCQGQGNQSGGGEKNKGFGENLEQE
jgi:hypothetical protein